MPKPRTLRKTPLFARSWISLVSSPSWQNLLGQLNAKTLSAAAAFYALFAIALFFVKI